MLPTIPIAVPWLVVASPRESTQHGLYLQYLFSADSSAVYLCLGQVMALTRDWGHVAGEALACACLRLHVPVGVSRTP